MLHSLWTRKGIALVAAIASVMAAVLLVWLTSLVPVSSAALGPEWQCSRVALLFTSCTRVGHAEPAAVRVNADAPCPDPQKSGTEVSHWPTGSGRGSVVR
jgi:hypothetical protein